MTETVARWVFPFSLVVAVAIWAKGYAAVGDGFSAGAVAGLGGIVQYVCRGHRHAARAVGAAHAWWLVGGGLLLSLGVLIAPVLAGVPPVTHWPEPDAAVLRLGIVEAHTAVAADLGIALLVYGALVGVFDRLFPPFEERMP